ncbi:MAG: ribosome-binding factor A [Pseudomonadota bacterium]
MYKSEKLAKIVLTNLYNIKNEVDELDDFFLNFLHIDVSKDSKNITCYYKTSNENKNNIIQYFIKNTLYIKHLLLNRIKMRKFPNIKFVYHA